MRCALGIPIVYLPLERNPVLTLAEVNALPLDGFVSQLGDVFEHSPWVARRAWTKRPFASVEALHQAMLGAVAEASREEQLALVRAHPELAGAEAKAGTLTVDSSSEQSRLGFTRLTSQERAAMSRLNREYREKHGFPCIVALRLHSDRKSVMAEMSRRLHNDSKTELGNALEQIGHITRGRLAKLVDG
jgi:2-oxo-4-hydroxy-4-carboxy-5-ureidoimidazoline decarboxylase